MLEQLQKKMIAAIYDDLALGKELVLAKDELNEDAQLAIYRGSVIGGLVDAMSGIYPAVKAAVGEKFFEAMATRYVAEHPSRSASLDAYGQYFVDFIGGFKPAETLPYLKDIAWLDWHWHRAFHQADPSALSWEELSQVSEEAYPQLRFELIDSLYCFTSNFPISKIWAMSRYPDDEAQEVDLTSGGEAVVVYRSGLDVVVDAVSQEVYWMLKSIKKRDSFGTICESWLSKFPHKEMTPVLNHVVSQAWLSGFSTED